MSRGNDNSSQKIPIRFAGETDESAAAIATDDESNEMMSQTLVCTEENEAVVDSDDAVDVIDGDTAPSLSEILQELEAQDQAESEALARERAAAEAGPLVSRGQRATAALAHQALTELSSLRAESSKFRSLAEKADEDKTDALDRLLRLQADFDNLRKRTERERGEIHSRLVIEVALKLLPVMDNLGRALKAEDAFQASESAEFRHFTGGVRLIFKQLSEVLEGFGIEAIFALGQPFDPQIHEAVATEQRDDLEPDLIVQEVATGYRMGKKLLRPSMVKVSTR